MGNSMLWKGHSMIEELHDFEKPERKKHSVYLSKEETLAALLVGNGNLNRGIRLALAFSSVYVLTRNKVFERLLTTITDYSVSKTVK